MSIKSVETAFLAFLRSFYVFSHWQHQLFLYRGIYSDAGEVALPAAGAGRKSAQVCGTCITILSEVVQVQRSPANRSIGSTTGFHNHREGPY